MNFDLFPWITGSFGFNKRALKQSVLTYANGLCDGFDFPIFIDFVRLPREIPGQGGLVFDDGSPRYIIALNNLYLDDIVDFVGYSKFIRGDKPDENGRFPAPTLTEYRHGLDMAYLRTMDAAGHEVEHFYQFLSKDPKMAVCGVATFGNRDSYAYSPNYLRDVREVSAEANSIYKLQKNFDVAFGEGVCDNLLLEYVNEISAYTGYWISSYRDEPFESMAAVHKAFDAAFDKAMAHKRVYPQSMKHSKDPFWRLTHDKDGRQDEKGYDLLDPEWLFMLEAVDAARTAYEVDRIYAAAAVHDKPDVTKHVNKDVLPPLDFCSVFGRDAPDVISEPLDQVAELKPEKPVVSEKMLELQAKLAIDDAIHAAKQKAKEKGGLDGPR